MRILNSKDPDISLKLIPFFIPEDQTRLEMGLELYGRLKSEPDNTLCLVAIENDIGQAMMIAYERERDVFVWQAWSRSGFKYQMTIFNGLISWAKSLGKDKLVAGIPERKRKFFERRYGFKPSGEVMEREI